MVKLSSFKKYIIPLLLCTHSAVFAETKGFYCIFRKSSGIAKEAHELQSWDSGFRENMTQDQELSELKILQNQLYNIINEAKRKDGTKPLSSELGKAACKILSFESPYGLSEVGIGYYSQWIIPSSIEIKGLSENKNKRWHFFSSSVLKVFLPLGSS